MFFDYVGIIRSRRFPDAFRTTPRRVQNIHYAADRPTNNFPSRRRDRRLFFFRISCSSIDSLVISNSETDRHRKRDRPSFTNTVSCRFGGYCFVLIDARLSNVRPAISIIAGGTLIFFIRYDFKTNSMYPICLSRQSRTNSSVIHAVDTPALY